MRLAPPSEPASQPVARDTPPRYSLPNGMNEAVFTGSSVPAACVLLEPALPMGFNSGKANTLTSVALPGPGAVTMLSRPVEKSMKPVAMLIPERSSPYGLKLEKIAGTAPGLDDSWALYTFTSLGTPGGDPTMILSDVSPSICAAATLTPPRAADSNASKCASSVPKVPLPRMDAPA